MIHQKDIQRALDRLPLVLAAVTAIPILTWACTHGSWRFLGQEFGGELFDELGRSLQHGEVTVPLNHESFYGRGQQTVIYFGPFPALLRSLLNAVAPSQFGNWSRLSCFGAALIALLGFHRLLLLAFKNAQLPPRLKYTYLGVLGLAFALGTPVLFAVSSPYLYHDSALWGLAGAVVGLGCLIALIQDGGKGTANLIGLSVSFGVTFLSRMTFGISLGVALGICGLALVTYPERREGTPPTIAHGRAALRFILHGLPAAVSVVFGLWYNWKRWGSITTFIDNRTYVNFVKNPQEMAHVMKIGTWDLWRIPDVLQHYFGLRTDYFANRFPYIRMAFTKYGHPDRFIQYNEWTVPLLVSAPWILVLAAGGFIRILRNRSLSPMARLSPLLFLPQTIFVLGFYFITQRYVLDLFPLLLCLAFYGIEAIPLLSCRSPRARAALLCATILLCGYSIAATVMSTLYWQTAMNWGATAEYRDSLRTAVGYCGYRY